MEMKSKLTYQRFAIAICAIVIFLSATTATAQRRKPVKHLSVCGNPNISCPSALTFQPYALPFRTPQSSVIYDTEFFYAVVLKSVSTANNNCDNYIPEPERLAAQ